MRRLWNWLSEPNAARFYSYAFWVLIGMYLYEVVH